MRFYLLIILSFVIFQTYSQPFGNEWINYSQKYYKFPVVQNGLYRISRTTMLNAGIPVENIVSAGFQLFARGQEQYIYVKTNAYGVLDYIEFYAEKNDGWLDTAFYSYPNQQTNPYYSLINDTIFYFLSWNNNTNNKRVGLETDVSFSSYSNVSYCFKEEVQSYNSSYLTGNSGPEYTSAEGWYDPTFGLGGQVTKTVNTPNAVSVSGVNAQVGYAVVSASNAASGGLWNHHLNVAFSSTYSFDTTFAGYKAIKKNFEVPSSSIGSTSPFVFSSINNLNALTDFMSVSYVRIKYPHNLDFLNNTSFKFSLPVFSSKKVLEISNFNSGTGTVFYDLANHKRITTVENSGIIKVLVPSGNELSECFIISTDVISNVSVLYPVNGSGNFTNLISSNANSDFIIISHPKLWTEAQNYRAYRNSSGHSACLANINELYEQYSYGINKHPLAIKNFINQALNTWTVKPQYLFLMGKSIHASYCRTSVSNYAYSLVPSMGNPSSDNMLTAGLSGENKYVQALATGRLTATANSNIKTYLDKVKEYELNQPQEWMKNIIHFGGGNLDAEQELIKSYLRNYEVIIEDTLFGGNVTSFFKNSSAPIQLTPTDSVQKLVNSGTTIITFFGHGSATVGFDQNIDDPENFNNRYKYPFIIANSCYAGDIHTGYWTVSEDWVLIPNKGAIGFFASVGEAYAQFLNKFTDELYRQISYKSYGKAIGECIKQSAKNNVLSSSSDIFVVNTSLEFTLNGDPAVVLNSFELPDLKINSQSIILNPLNITTENDSFELNIVVKNIGKAIRQPFIVEIKRTFSDNSSELIVKTMSQCLYADTLKVNLPVDFVRGPGINKLDVMVDAVGEINESDETNNTASTNFIILSSDVIPVLPYKYAIVPDNDVTLIASTGNPFAIAKDYIFQIDTTDLFNSSLLTSQIINSSGGIVSWKPPFTMADSTVYYWRVSNVPSGAESYKWHESSFIIIPEITGWSQAHFYQFKNDNYQYINFNRNNRSFDFVASPHLLKIRNIGKPSEGGDVRFSIDNSVNNGLGDYACCWGQHSIMVAVIDSFRYRAWPSDTASFGQNNFPQCPSRTRVDYYFIFNSSDSLTLVSMANFVTNVVPDGDYIIMYDYWNGNFMNWPEVAYQAFESLSSVPLSIRNIPPYYPYIFFVKKGHPETAKEMLGDYDTDDISYEKILEEDFNRGNIYSEIAGPANKWNSFHWKDDNVNVTFKDSSVLSIIGIGNSGGETILMDSIVSPQNDISNLDQIIDASLYPYLRLNYFTRDDSLKTPMQLKKWQLYYDGIPETALNPKEGFYFYKDTVDEGENITFSIATQNISKYDMDSLRILYWVKDKNNEDHTISTKVKRPHPAGDILIDTVQFSSIGYPGLNSIWVEVNPENPATGSYYQLEQYHFNNVAQKFFYVNSDRENPLLDVTFDGFHILNGDIVSAKPQIIIQLKDENKYLALNDTSLFAVYIKRLETDEDEKRIYFSDISGNEIMQWIPAQLPKNSCKIIYNGTFDDGKYQLRVQAKDASNNESGANDYLINFEIVNKSTITDIFNYPNPFSTSTRFVFTLTGSELPDELSIQILTVTGKLVRVINLDELGNVHVGRNITDFAWDGTDMFGDKLANGVYFYRVITKLNGQSIEKRETGAEKYFKKEFGKMYIMR